MYRCSQSDVIGLRLDDFLEVQRCGFMFMVRRILEIVKIHWFFHEKRWSPKILRRTQSVVRAHPPGQRTCQPVALPGACCRTRERPPLEFMRPAECASAAWARGLGGWVRRVLWTLNLKTDVRIFFCGFSL